MTLLLINLEVGIRDGEISRTSNHNDPYSTNQANTVRDPSAATYMLSMSILTIYLGTGRIATGWVHRYTGYSEQ